jgi:cancer susceptibility candidate protein 1
MVQLTWFTLATELQERHIDWVSGALEVCPRNVLFVFGWPNLCRSAEAPFRVACSRTCIANQQAVDNKNSWARYTSCVPHPDPKISSQIQDYIILKTERKVESLADTLQCVEDTLAVIDESTAVAVKAIQRNQLDEVKRIEEFRVQLFQLISQQIDAFTIWFLSYSDRFASVEGDIKRELSLGRVSWAVWLNINKNPRLKAIEFPRIGFQLDIHKQLALAPIAVRAVLLNSAEEYFQSCKNQWYAVGPVILVDLLMLPLMARATANEWTFRPQGPLSAKLQRLPYPIPPVGADPSTWQSDDEIPPLGFNTEIEPNLAHLAGESIQVPPSVSLNVGLLNAWADHSTPDGNENTSLTSCTY